MNSMNPSKMKDYWTSLATLMGVLAFCQTLLHSVLPPELRAIATKLFSRLFRSVSSYCYFDVAENDGVGSNVLYNAVQLYLSNSASVSASRLSLSRHHNSSSFTFSLTNNDRLDDIFNGIKVTWEHTVTPRQNNSGPWRSLSDDKRGFTLKIKKKDRQQVSPDYLQHIIDVAAELRQKSKERLIYTNSRGGGGDRGHPWESVPFKHPSTFQTLAMDPLKKEEIMDDLKDFAEGKAFYERRGRAWKRGYLLYGPPGTGKSSMIAAIANYLQYDIYDLELTEVQTNSELRKLLMKTAPKSIIVIEDIDCSVNLVNRKKVEVRKRQAGEGAPKTKENGGGGEEVSEAKTVTLSGLLNFTDGLWSCCGSERIFVFTTNHVDKLDPALLRSGRMDLHILMSYCSFPALKILLKNYLGLEDGEFDDFEEVLKELGEVIGEAEITPADVSEVLIKNRRKKKGESMAELLNVLRERIEKKKETIEAHSGVLVKEEEKRTLESSNDGEEVINEDNAKDEKLHGD